MLWFDTKKGVLSSWFRDSVQFLLQRRFRHWFGSVHDFKKIVAVFLRLNVGRPAWLHKLKDTRRFHYNSNNLVKLDNSNQSNQKQGCPIDEKMQSRLWLRFWFWCWFWFDGCDGFGGRCFEDCVDLLTNLDTLHLQSLSPTPRPSNDWISMFVVHCLWYAWIICKQLSLLELQKRELESTAV